MSADPCDINILLVLTGTCIVSAFSLPAFFSIYVFVSTSFLSSESLISLTVMRSDCLSDSGQFYYSNLLLKLHSHSQHCDTNHHRQETNTCVRTSVYICEKTHTHTHTHTHKTDKSRQRIDVCSASRRAGLGRETQIETRECAREHTHKLLLYSICSQ